MSRSPSRRKDLHAEHCPSLQPCMSMTPCRNAALRTVSSSSTSISMPTGSKRTVCLAPIRVLSCLGTCGTRAPGRGPWLSRRLAGYGCRPAAWAALAVVSGERLTFLGGHGVQQDVGAWEGTPAEVVERPQLLRIVEIQVGLGDERLA